MKRNAFTLAEVLITLAIIGVVAALTIPSVVANTQQQEFKTGLRKAVSVLNSSITMNMALDGQTPYDLDRNTSLFDYLQRHMSIMKSTTDLSTVYYADTPYASRPGLAGDHIVRNKVFYTTDGMRFETYKSQNAIVCHRLHEGGCATIWYDGGNCVNGSSNHLHDCRCGSYGLASNTDNTWAAPCLITVDVNGDRKPSPANVNCKSASCAKPYKLSDITGKKLSDVFSIMITDKQAIPYGVAAQKAMYEAQK